MPNPAYCIVCLALAELGLKQEGFGVLMGKRSRDSMRGLGNYSILVSSVNMGGPGGQPSHESHAGVTQKDLSIRAPRVQRRSEESMSLPAIVTAVRYGSTYIK